MIVRVPFLLIHHIILVFTLLHQRAQGISYYDYEADPAEDCPHYVQEVPEDNFEKYIISEEPVDYPNTERPYDDYYYVEEPDVHQYQIRTPVRVNVAPEVRCPAALDGVNVDSEVRCPAALERVVEAPPKAPVTFRRPICVFDATDLC